MSEILYHKQGLFGSKIEIHIAPEGITMVGRSAKGAVEYAPIEDISAVTVEKSGRKSSLTISFGTTRPAWTLNGLPPSSAEWAKAVIEEEKLVREKQAKPEYSSSLSLEQIKAVCSEITASSNGRTAVDLSDFLLVQAALHGASDVHFDPFSDAVMVRYRLDGVLQDVVSLPSDVKRRLTARLKVVSKLATFRHSVAQEGRAALKIGNRTVDFRFSSIPTIHGEKVTVRIFDPEKSIFDIDCLGMDPQTLASYKKLLMQPQGTILMTGPASSGKTTTMYASLSYLREQRKNLSSIATVEDPVEYDLQVINQTQINNTSGLTFANALRTVLRQDPEVIMIGEIRDRETADIATQAGLTGHMILSTVHARSAPGVLLRLIDLGVEPFLVSSAVTAVLSQRLVRTVCKNCVKPYEPTPEEMEKFDCGKSNGFVKGAGCEKCENTGYAGRTGIFQLMPVSDTLREMVIRHSSIQELEEQVRKERIETLLDDGLKKAKAGITTLEELTRVLG